jgi:hypothetical protein
MYASRCFLVWGYLGNAMLMVLIFFLLVVETCIFIPQSKQDANNTVDPGTNFLH